MPRRAARRHLRALRQIGGLGQRHQEPRVEGGAGDAPDARPVHRRTAQLAVAHPAEERLHQRMARREGIVLLVSDGNGAPERAEHHPVAREVESCQRVHLQLGPDVERDLAREHVDLHVHRQPYPPGRFDGDHFEPPLEMVGDRGQRHVGLVPRQKRHAQPVRPPPRQRADRVEVAAAAVEERVDRPHHLGPRRGDALGEPAQRAFPELLVVGDASAERRQLRFDGLQDVVEPAHRLAEHADRLVEQVEDARGEGSFRPEGEDAHLARLADAVDAADALLDRRRAPGEIVVHEHMTVLEVATLSAQLGAEQHARPLGIAETRHQLVPLGRGEVSGVRQRLDALALPLRPRQLQPQVLDRLARLGEHQHLLTGQLAVEQLAERLQLGIVLGRKRRGARRERPERLVP